MGGDLTEILAADPSLVAPRLIGALLTTTIGSDVTSLRLTEVEAYAGDDDPASHAYRGPTQRNASMFGQPAHLYVYRSYGIHDLVNIVTCPAGTSGAVLVRAGIPQAGRPIMERRRGRRDHLCDGPGKLAQALGLTLDHDGIPLNGGVVSLALSPLPVPTTATPRIGISKGVATPWRFVASSDPEET